MAKGTVAAKTKSKTTNNASAAIHHPPYFEMISEAILTLKERNGSSQPAIAKFIEDKYKTGLPPNFKKLLSVQLKKFVKSERLEKVKNSYKVSSIEKLKLVIKEAQSETPKQKSGSKKAEKTKRLSQVKTPDGLKKDQKKNKKKIGPVKTPDIAKNEQKSKRLSQVKTPDWFKKNKQNSKASSRKR